MGAETVRRDSCATANFHEFTSAKVINTLMRREKATTFGGQAPPFWYG
jgi:hypothetical protein